MERQKKRNKTIIIKKTHHLVTHLPFTKNLIINYTTGTPLIAHDIKWIPRATLLFPTKLTLLKKSDK